MRVSSGSVLSKTNSAFSFFKISLTLYERNECRRLFNEVKLAQPVPVKRRLNILTVFVRTLQ